ncbi:HD-GYP domain-containing protein [Marinobacter sp. F3R11]|uniref:HD-GYP domain-containing protein n=1 Tax=Marinobacter sp. F3R11 TaxID=2267231 RepID=UPI000DEB600C|nr:HD domain-containing phosphohydrolase [Marinobacter sp. F3R11]RBW51945.1 phosphohydrolase [Marinobacter sp. F3R11]
MSDLVRIAPGALIIGRPLPWDVYDADGHILLCQGYVIQTDSQLEQLFERGHFEPRVIEAPQEDTEVPGSDTESNPFASYPGYLHTLEQALAAIADSKPEARKHLQDLAYALEQACIKAPDSALALIHLYSVGPTIHEQIIFYAILCQLIARQFGLDEQRIPILTEAALSANLALVPVADKLNAFNKILSTEQRSVIRKHPQRSISALKAAGIDNDLLFTIIAQHHEQADGGGYPDGLSGADIRPESEILAMAERYIAMITKRAYRKRMNVTAARKLISSLADGTYRPAIPKALLHVLGEYPPGTLVRLENNEVGVITRRPLRARGPFVQAVFDPSANSYDTPRERDTSVQGFNILAIEEPDVMPSMDFSQMWGYNSETPPRN